MSQPPQPQQMVAISNEEYKYLQTIVLDVADMVELMAAIRDLFLGFTDNEGEAFTLASLGKTILTKPGKFKKVAEDLAPKIIAMGPYVQKYGPHAAQMKEHVKQSITGQPAGQPQ